MRNLIVGLLALFLTTPVFAEMGSQTGAYGSVGAGGGSGTATNLSGAALVTVTNIALSIGSPTNGITATTGTNIASAVSLTNIAAFGNTTVAIMTNAANIISGTGTNLTGILAGNILGTAVTNAQLVSATNNLLATVNANILTATNNNLASANANILTATNNLLVTVNANILSATNGNLASATTLIQAATNAVVTGQLVSATNASFSALTNYLEATVFITNFAIPTYRTNYTVSLAGLGVTTNLLIREDLYLVPQSSNPLVLKMISGTLLNSKGIGGADNAGCPPFAQTTSDGGLTWSVIYTGETHISFADTNGSPTTVSPIQAAANFNLQARYSWVKHQ